MNRASSRLKIKPKKKLRVSESQNNRKIQTSSNIQRNQTQTIKPQKIFFSQYLEHLPTLLLAFMSGFGLWKLISTVRPQEIKHFILPNTYLPFLILFFLTIFFITSYFLLNTRRGFFISLFLTIISFLKLQQVILEIWLIASLALSFIIIEFIASFRLKKKNKNIVTT